ncbi:hypothetical protein MZG85_18630, partial [Escherichia coli]|nr:hypothetical protein [Escherichia coli]
LGLTIQGFNTAWQWGEREEQAVKQLGKLIQERL